MKKIAIVASICLFSLGTAYAQQDTTMNRTVIVENEYNPTVMDASKINVMPKVEEPKAAKRNIDYATSLRPVSSWNYQAMSPVVREWETDKAYRGYLRAGYGNNGNVDIKAGYLWDMTPKDRLNVAASVDGWNGNLLTPDNSDWKSRLYNTKVGLDYRHAFKKADFLLGGSYRSQVFNYMQLNYNVLNAQNNTQTYSPDQHQTLANMYLGLASTDKELAVQYQGELGINYYKQKYPNLLEEGYEKTVYLKGDVWKPFDEQSFGLKFNFSNYLYSMQGMEDATSLELNPYYTFKNENLRVRLGAHVDWWSGVEDKVKFSPDINLEYIFSESYVLYAKVGGGRENRSFYELTDLTPYWSLVKPAIYPTYVLFDASAGLMASPVNGLWFNLTGGYQARENDLCFDLDGRSAITYACFNQGKTKAAYGSLELKYDYKDLFGLSVKGTYYNWEWEDTNGLLIDELTALALKPEFELNANIDFKVLEGLKVNVGYDYVKRCEGLYDPISDLHMGAAYELLDNVQVFGRIHNLLDKDYYRMDGYPAQGLNVLAGVSLRF